MTLKIPTASSANDLHARLQAYRQGVSFVARLVGLNQVDAVAHAAAGPQATTKLWKTNASTGNVARGDGLFFAVQGLELRPKGLADDARYMQPIVREAPPAGTVVLVCDTQTGDVLLQMKTEAGSDPQRNYTTFGPSLQVSSSRLALARANQQDAAMPLLGALVGLGVLPARGVGVQQDPGRFLNKRNDNRVAFVDGKGAVDVAATPSLVWARVSDFEDEVNVEEGNEFLWQMLGLLAREQRQRTDGVSSAV